MKTEQEIRLKLQQLTEQLGNFTDPRQISIVKGEIRRVAWILGEGPDFVLVPVKI